MSTQAKPGPRERLLDSARELTYTHGVTVGVDAILEDAGVARRSLYQHFGGKEGLIAETLCSTADVDVQRYCDALDSGGEDPRQRLLAVFDALEQTTSSKRFHGCRYTAADLSLTDPDHPAHAETRAYKQRLHTLFASELQALGHPTPDRAADQLLLLIDGVLVHAVTRPETHPAKAARELAEHVLDVSQSKQRTPRRAARAD
ncbi:MAG: TetR/AcrR family transcriptional regulator [Solirubrobacteraceae bacterium]